MEHESNKVTEPKFHLI